MNPISLETDWKFWLDGATGARTLSVPHDWSIEGERTAEAPSRGDGGYFPTGIGWYSRALEVPQLWEGQRVFVEFEGVAGLAEVLVNEFSLGVHPYAFTPFEFDITEHLRDGGPNVLMVKVDNSAQPACRWYTGSGIYRPVRLRVVPERHIESVFIETHDVHADYADLKLNVQLQGTDVGGVELEIRDADGEVALKQAVDRIGFVELPKPRLWSLDSPHVYTATVRLWGGGEVIHEVETQFGVRTVDYSAQNGFELNGESLKLCGGNLHQDQGPLGTAVFPGAEERRVRLLKAAGFNAVRMAHNPPSTAFLDACDRLGLLVIDEIFDGWAKKKLAQDYARYFHDWWERDVEAMVRRDRNHACVIAWSIGNEVFERGSEEGAEIARKLSERIRELDSTRPVTIGLNGLGPKQPWSDLDRVFKSVQLAGYNYEIARHAEDHARVPNRVMFSSESYQNDVFEGWAACDSHPYVVGDFVWSAWDYLGEAGLGRVFRSDETAALPWEASQYPWHGAMCGDLDLTGFRKPISHYRNIVWDRGETLYLAVAIPAPDNRPWQVGQWAVPPAQSSWTWPGREGQPLPVEVYSRHETVRLYLNGALIGEQPTTAKQRFKATFLVPYAPGRLEAVGIRDGAEAERFAVETAGPPEQLRLSAERFGELEFVTVEVTDAEGRLCPLADLRVKYELEGPGTIAGVGSGDLSSDESYQANPRRVFQGRSLVVLRGTGPGSRLRASGDGVEPGSVGHKSR